MWWTVKKWTRNLLTKLKTVLNSFFHFSISIMHIVYDVPFCHLLILRYSFPFPHFWYFFWSKFLIANFFAINPFKWFIKYTIWRSLLISNNFPVTCFAPLWWFNECILTLKEKASFPCIEPEMIFMIKGPLLANF